MVRIHSTAPTPRARLARAFSRVPCPPAPRRLWALVAAACIAAQVCAQPVPPHGDEVYRPKPGQRGKDVMWLGTPETMVAAMLKAARVGPADLVVDLGAGDGRIAIAAARDFGARAVGIEYEPPMADLARRNAVRAGVADRVRIVTGDIFREDFSQASVVTMYLLPELNLQLRPQLLDMKPGTRIVSYAWTMAEWEPDELIRAHPTDPYPQDAYAWIVPAKAAGRWSIAEVGGSFRATLELEQRFQKIGGTIAVDDARARQPILGAYLVGTDLGFTFVDRDGGVKALRLALDGDRAGGTSRLGEYVVRVTAQRGR